MRSPRFTLPLLLSAFILPPSSCLLSQVVVEKPEFRQLVDEKAPVEKLLTGYRFLEGPSWNPVDGFLVFSDNVDDRLYKYEALVHTGHLFRHPSGMANGTAYNSKGELFSCEQDPHRVTVTRLDGKVEAFPDTFEGKAFSSPNDVVIKSDGTVWFTDPTYGLGKRKKEQATNNVYCYDPARKEMRAVATDFHQPNGLCFSPDEDRLYMADSGRPHHVRVFDVSRGNDLSNGRIFCVIDKGGPDGMRCDKDGNLWSSAGDGVQVFNPAGERLGRILTPECPANLCFGGAQGNELYLTARTSLYLVKVKATGVPAK